MSFVIQLISLLDTAMERPTLYGWFHIMCLVLTVIVTTVFCIRGKHDSAEKVRKVVFWTAEVVAILEVYKQINYTFKVVDGAIVTDYQWYAFPWQFCSTPMYVGLLTGIIRKGKIHDCLCAYLATYAIFAGVVVMLYPADIYIDTIGINIQTSICHCSMIVIGGYLYATGHVKLEHKTILKALPVFAAAAGVAVILNEVAYFTGITPNETFNMFFFSRHCDPSLPVYSLVQAVVPYPWSLILYIAGFTAAAYIMVLIAMAVHHLTRKKQPIPTV